MFFFSFDFNSVLRYMTPKFKQKYTNPTRMARAQMALKTPGPNSKPMRNTLSREYRQLTISRTIQAASGTSGTSMDMDFVADETENATEMDQDTSDPLGISNMAE